MGLSVFSLKANVLTALTPLIASGDADVVQLGIPADVPATSDPRRVYILNTPSDTPNPVFSGSTQVRREEFVVPIALEVVDYSGNDPDGQGGVLTEMQALVTAVENVLLGDPTWGGAVHQSGFALATETTAPLAAQAGGWISKALLELHAMRRGS
jgi:hypothetical protein